MDCPAALAKSEKREVQCGKYSLTILDAEGPVMVQGESCGLWTARGDDARILIEYADSDPVKAEAYIDDQLEKTRDALRRIWRSCHDV